MKLSDECESFLNKYRTQKMAVETAWNAIPKNCPFYEMAPEEYDSHSYEHKEMCSLALKLAECLLVERMTDAWKVDKI